MTWLKTWSRERGGCTLCLVSSFLWLHSSCSEARPERKVELRAAQLATSARSFAALDVLIFSNTRRLTLRRVLSAVNQLWSRIMNNTKTDQSKISFKLM